MKVWENANRSEGDFLNYLKADDDVSSRLSDSQLEGLFDLDYHFEQVDVIFGRVFGES